MSIKKAVGMGGGAILGAAFGGPSGALMGAQLGGGMADGFTTGSDRGRSQRDFNRAAFPGTTPWEHLGSSAGAANTQAANQSKVADRQMQSNERIAKLQATNQQEVARLEALAGTARTILSTGNDGGSKDLASAFLREAGIDLPLPHIGGSGANQFNTAQESVNVQGIIANASTRQAAVSELNAENNRIMSDIQQQAVDLDRRKHDERWSVEKAEVMSRTGLNEANARFQALGYSGRELLGLNNAIEEMGGLWNALNSPAGKLAVGRELSKLAQEAVRAVGNVASTRAAARSREGIAAADRRSRERPTHETSRQSEYWTPEGQRRIDRDRYIDR